MTSLYSHSSQYKNWTFSADRLEELRKEVHLKSMQSLAKSRQWEKLIALKVPDHQLLTQMMQEQLEEGALDALEGPLITVQDQIVYTRYWESKIMNYCTVFNLDLTVQVTNCSNHYRRQRSYCSRDFILEILFLNMIPEYT